MKGRHGIRTIWVLAMFYKLGGIINEDNNKFNSYQHILNVILLLLLLFCTLLLMDVADHVIPDKTIICR
jgi:hypothetical protein